MGSPPYELAIPFQLRERDGVVSVSIRSNDSPVESGHHLLVPSLTPTAVFGFPIMTATIDSQCIGPRAWCGWIQVLHLERKGHPTEHLVDAINLNREDSPLYCFGYLPTLADAPASPGHPDMDWHADSFLVARPGIVGARAIGPVCSFSWGYDLRDGRPSAIHEPAVTGPEAWERCRPTLDDAYRGWTFLDQLPAER